LTCNVDTAFPEDYTSNTRSLLSIAALNICLVYLSRVFCDLGRRVIEVKSKDWSSDGWVALWEIENTAIVA